MFLITSGLGDAGHGSCVPPEGTVPLLPAQSPCARGVVYPRPMGGVDGGVAFVPAVPGLAPGAFMGQGLPVLSSRPGKRARGMMRSCWA